LIVSPIESIKTVFEIKSTLGKTELDKIFEEVKNINETAKIGIQENPKVVGFSYKCLNSKLAYFDFVSKFITSPLNTPYVICILNVGILCFIDKASKIIATTSNNIFPILIPAKEDALLLFIYLLMQLLVDEQTATTLRQYSKHIYEDLGYFRFEDSFIDKIKGNNPDILRDCFKGNLEKSIEEAYEEAKAI
jgi:hypothetical protein